MNNEGVLDDSPPVGGRARAHVGRALPFPPGAARARGRLAVVDLARDSGGAQPPHVHDWEDEVLYVLDGAAEFSCGPERLTAGAGDYVFIPRGTPHAVAFRTEVFRVMRILSAFDGRPARGRHATRLLAPDDAAALLPDHPRHVAGQRGTPGQPAGAADRRGGTPHRRGVTALSRPSPAPARPRAVR